MELALSASSMAPATQMPFLADGVSRSELPFVQWNDRQVWALADILVTITGSMIS
jgi:hypothetical protein